VSEEIIGLLQLNDHRLNQLTPEMIRFFEGLGASVGIALSRKRAEDALRESEDRFLDVLHASSDAMLMIDTERFVDCNEATVQLLGYSTREEFLTTHPSELSPPTQADGRESFEKANEMMKLAFESGFHQFEWIHRKANGEDFPVQVSLTPILVQGKNLLHCVWRDITAHKLAESALQASESRFRGIFDHVTDGILLADIETKAFVIANWAICEILGYSEEELLKLQVNDIHPADSHAAIEEAFGKLLRGEIKIAHDLPVVRKDGSVFFADISAAPITIENRRLLMANFRDVTEKRALQAAAAQNDRLASMGMLAAGVAHEVNNPLSYVLYNLESLSDEIPRLAAYRDALERHLGAEKLRDVLGDRSDAFTGPMFTNLSERFGDALGGVGRIKAIVRDLGTFSRVDSDDRQPVNFSHAIEQAVSIAYNEIRYRARLVKDFGKLPTVLAGDGRIAQVFLNLLINAARAIDEGDIENNQIRVHTWVEGDFICAEVSDTGRGIPAEHLERIFEPFFTTRPGGAGSGLGLAICRNIISSYKGTIEVESVVGKGTRFLIRLPVLGEEAEARPIEAAGKMEPEVPAVRGRILVVDDEPGIRSVVTKILGREHEVLSAASGKEGQATIENDQAFDVILCDLMMPGMSGMALHDWLSGFNPTLARQVVFITGGAFTPKASDYLDKVGNLRIEKPFEAADLRKTVNELIVAARNGK
jgi:PAS domain S-box-containing protein